MPENKTINLLENILNGIDAYLYVSDVKTDEILFINDNMRIHFGLGDDIVGQTCWKVLQSGFTERCTFCPCFELEKGEKTMVTWEELNTVTGQSYRNTDCLIDWVGGTKVHLQHSVDISDIKMAELELKKQLEQQALMANLSQQFIDTSHLNQKMFSALESLGTFLGSGNAVLAQCADNSLYYKYEWDNNTDVIAPKLGTTIPLSSFDDQMIEGFKKQRPTECTTAALSPENTVSTCHLNESNGMVFPVYEEAQLWGILLFEKMSATDTWSDSDINLGKMAAGIFSGVFNRLRMEREVLRLSSIVRSSPQNISLIDDDGSYIYFNNALETVSGYSETELQEKGASLIFDGDAYQELINTHIPAAKTNSNTSFEAPIITKDNETRIMSFSAFTTGLAEDGTCTIATDITAMRDLEKDLIQAKEWAEKNSAAKSDFLSKMSHEMRTPMNAIIGMTNIALSTDSEERQRYCLGKINGASNHLLGVINDILDMSKIEANKFDLSFSDYSFEKMLINVVNVIHFRVDEKKQTLSLQIDTNLPTMVTGDEQRLAQVITNLLTNATKFTEEEGSIGLAVRLLEDDGQEITLQIEISDTGIGITEEQQSRLFRAFEQADSGITRRFGGTGLGLAISKRIVELMGGSIWVTSVEGEGSTFAFTTKLTKAPEPKKSDELLALPSKLHVLFVDDSLELLEYCKHIISQMGYSCDTALSGNAALKLLEATETPYDIIFVDWRMPVLDGVELTKRIRKFTKNSPVIIMMSIAEWSEIEKEALEAGINSFMPKPLFPSLLAQCFIEYFAESMPKKSNSQKLPDFGHSTILLAEDIEINREIVATLLEDTNITIDMAENGLFAVSMFNKNPQKYDLILMDMQMPEMDGVEAAKQIRALPHPESKTIPIVAMTANVFREDVEICLAAGMNAHLAKPIDFDLLLETLKSYILK